MTSVELKEQILCMIEFKKEELEDRSVSASRLIGALLIRWIEQHEKAYLRWPKRNLSWIHQNYRFEFNRLATVFDYSVFANAYTEEYIKSCARAHRERRMEREMDSDEFTEENPTELL